MKAKLRQRLDEIKGLRTNLVGMLKTNNIDRIIKRCLANVAFELQSLAI
jgi:hypothetical protein